MIRDAGETGVTPAEMATAIHADGPKGMANYVRAIKAVIKPHGSFEDFFKIVKKRGGKRWFATARVKEIKL
jgi:hypothetical protein